MFLDKKGHSLTGPVGNGKTQRENIAVCFFLRSGHPETCLASISYHQSDRTRNSDLPDIHRILIIV